MESRSRMVAAFFYCKYLAEITEHKKPRLNNQAGLLFVFIAM